MKHIEKTYPEFVAFCKKDNLSCAEKIFWLIKENLESENDLPDEFKHFFEYLETYFNINKKNYTKQVLRDEIKSRMKDLKM